MTLKVELPEFTLETLIHFIRDFTRGKGVVLGLSGGLDSAVVLALCAKALGPEKVLALHMPDAITPESEQRDAEEVAQLFDVALRVINIENIVNTIVSTTKLQSLLAIANIKARARMLILYAIANEEGRLVAGTSNKSELLTGYFTKYGDGASDFAPIGDLYKTQVRQLARLLDIPEHIIQKNPSANLVPGQEDEKELGIDYVTLDKVLYGIELGLEKDVLIQKIGDEKAVNRVFELYARSRHKRVMLYIPKIGVRTINTDWRE